MEFNRVHDNSAIAGTYLVGSIKTTRRRIEAVFGNPDADVSESKIRYHWAGKFSDGLPFTIYDWKQYRDIDLDEPHNWHIGGKDPLVVARLNGMV